MKLSFKIFKIIIAFVIGLGGFLYSLRLLINTFYKKTYLDEDVIQLIQNHSLLTIFIFVVFLTIILIIIKIFPKVSKYFKKHNPLLKAIFKYESYFAQGEYDKVLSAFNSKSIWKRFPSYQYSINKLAAKICLIDGKEKLCFHSISKAYVYAKTDVRKIELLKIKFQLFISSGAISGAKLIFETLQTLILKSHYKPINHYESLLLEMEGNLDEAFKELKASASIIDIFDLEDSVFIYNNLGRIAGLLKSHFEEFEFYEKAKDSPLFKKNKYFSHIIYQNLISMYLLTKNYGKAFPLLNEYSNIIDKNNKYDLLEYYNYLLIYNRQIENKPEFIKAIEFGHNYLFPLLNKAEQFASNISELNFRFNNNVYYFDLLHTIESDLPNHTQLNLPERLFAYKIIIKAITKKNGRLILHPFDKLYKTIFTYFRNSISEVDDYIINELENFQILSKCSLLKDKVMLYNYQPYNISNCFDLIQEKLKLIEDITGIYLTYGNLISSLESKLNFVDECMGSLQNTLNPEQSQSLKNKMLLSFQKVESEIQPYLKHPEMPPLFIRIAKYASFLDMFDLTKKYLDKFKESNLNINHFAACIQNYYNDVNNYLEN
ncbi:MAG: hypothetical protein M0P61_01960 [Ignavibacteriaceae bacterium]|jgi:hypothetical protein|nr:hypothetical protein [Ignavibacteriaceae bacterium]